MKSAVKGLKSAIGVLGVATATKKKSSLLVVRQNFKEGASALLEERSNLREAIELSSRFLGKADSLFLRRLLLGEVPQVSLKKLNPKASFKMKYKARSLKIQDVFKKTLETFELNLKEAEAKEAVALQDFKKLHKAKSDQLSAAKTALTQAAVENGARALSKEEAVDELKSLKTQVGDDQKFIKQTETALAVKKKEWKARQVLRSGELQAISKAINILYSDDAQDLMKKSFSSQGYLFLQVAMTSQEKAAISAEAALRDAARRSGDARLVAIASVLADPAPKSVKATFEPVLKAIEKMMAVLKSDEAKDLATKQTCEKDRMSDTRKVLIASRAIDDMTDKVMHLEEEIGLLTKNIQALQVERRKVKEELDAGTKIRKDEQAAFLKAEQDDKKAAETIKSAKKVLERFYKDNNLGLIQVRKAPVVETGATPPPPPATWEGSYGGKTSETTGVIAILDMVYSDILQDMAKAKEAEGASQKEYDSFKSESEKQMKNLKDEENDKAKVKGKKETEKMETVKSRNTKKSELDGTVKKMKAVDPHCEYFEVHYVMRRTNRHIELDGLQKAMTLLRGGTFTEGEDPRPEIKPGDAAMFLQRRV
jgi:hypothetical protein